MPPLLDSQGVPRGRGAGTSKGCSQRIPQVPGPLEGSKPKAALTGGRSVNDHPTRSVT